MDLISLLFHEIEVIDEMQTDLFNILHEFLSRRVLKQDSWDSKQNVAIEFKSQFYLNVTRYLNNGKNVAHKN